jgi:hypothetical protein
VLDVRGDQRRLERRGMRRDGDIEVLEADAPPFQILL